MRGIRTEVLLALRLRHPRRGWVRFATSARAVRDPEGRAVGVLRVTHEAAAPAPAARLDAGAEVEAARREVAAEAALRRVATATAGRVELFTVLRDASREVAALLGVSRAAVYRFDAGRVVAMSRGDDQPDLDCPAGEAISGASALSRVAETGQAARIEPGTTSAVAVPVCVDGGLWGAVLAASPGPGRVPPDAESFLERMAELVALAVTGEETLAGLTAQARTDPLTGLANQRGFNERLREEVARAQRHDRPLSLVMLDVDHFKRINDVHGHQSGDLVLAEVGRRLRRVARAGELVARVGGEEFAWLLPETTADQALAAAERARAAVSAEPVHAGEQMSLSAGVCDLGQGLDAEGMVRFADGALYWCKDQGRGMACRYSPDLVRIFSAEERAERMARRDAVRALVALARAAETGAPAAASHCDRVGALAREIAVALGWSGPRAVLLAEAALLHEVGAVGRREDDPALSADMAAVALSAEQCEWIRSRAERWDGASGRGAQHIPEGARIIAVADTWDTLATRRDGPAAAPVDAIAEIERLAGAQLWPDGVAALRRILAGGAGPGTPGGAEIVSHPQLSLAPLDVRRDDERPAAVA